MLYEEVDYINEVGLPWGLMTKGGRLWGLMTKGGRLWGLMTKGDRLWGLVTLRVGAVWG